MNRQIEITLDGGDTFHLPSQNVVYMTPDVGGVAELGYMSGSRLVKRNVTTTPATLESEVSYLAEINSTMFSLINSNHIIGTLDGGSSHDLKYQIPEGRLIDLGVTMTLSSLHSEMTKSIGDTELDALKDDVIAAEAALATATANIITLESDIVNHQADIVALTTGLATANGKISTMEDGVSGPKKDKE